MRTRHLEDDLRTLELEPGATAHDIKKAWRDMTKVWHPDRFGSDPELRKKADDKLKAINEAYERLKTEPSPSSRTRRREGTAGQTPREWRVRGDGQEAVAHDFATLLMWAVRGKVDPTDEVFHPDQQRWIPLTQIPELAPVFARRGRGGAKGAIVMAAVAGLTVLIRRPTLGGILSAVVIFFVTYIIMSWGRPR